MSLDGTIDEPITSNLHNFLVLLMCILLFVWILQLVLKAKALYELKSAIERQSVIRIDTVNPAIDSVGSVTADHLRQMIRSKLTCHTESSVELVRVQCHLIPGTVKILRGTTPGTHELKFKISLNAPTEVCAYIGLERSEITKYFPRHDAFKKGYEIQESDKTNGIKKTKRTRKDNKIRLFRSRRTSSYFEIEDSASKPWKRSRLDGEPVNQSCSSHSSFLSNSSEQDTKSQYDQENIVMKSVSYSDPKFDDDSFLKAIDPFVVHPVVVSGRDGTNELTPPTTPSADPAGSASTRTETTSGFSKDISIIFLSADLLDCLATHRSYDDDRCLVVITLKTSSSSRSVHAPPRRESRQSLAKDLLPDSCEIQQDLENEEKAAMKSSSQESHHVPLIPMTEVSILEAPQKMSERKPTHIFNELLTISVEADKEPEMIEINSPLSTRGSISIHQSSARRLEHLSRYLSSVKVSKQHTFLPSTVVELQDIFGIDEPSELDCSVCLTAPKSVILLPCRHCCVCYTCFQQIDKCPVCRESVISFMRFPSKTDEMDGNILKRKSTSNSISLQYALAPLTQQPN